MTWTIRKHELSYQIIEGDIIIATVHNVERVEGKRANADKMCASNDLYEVGKGIDQWLSDHTIGFDPQDGGALHALQIQLQDALAKAEGKS